MGSGISRSRTYPQGRWSSSSGHQWRCGPNSVSPGSEPLPHLLFPLLQGPIEMVQSTWERRHHFQSPLGAEITQSQGSVEALTTDVSRELWLAGSFSGNLSLHASSGKDAARTQDPGQVPQLLCACLAWGGFRFAHPGSHSPGAVGAGVTGWPFPSWSHLLQEARPVRQLRIP